MHLDDLWRKNQQTFLALKDWKEKVVKDTAKKVVKKTVRKKAENARFSPL